MHSTRHRKLSVERAMLKVRLRIFSSTCSKLSVFLHSDSNPLLSLHEATLQQLTTTGRLVDAKPQVNLLLRVAVKSEDENYFLDLRIQLVRHIFG